MRTPTILLLTLVSSAWLAAPAAAQASTPGIYWSSSWVQGAAGTNFGTASTDLDTGTGELAAWCEYQGLVGDLLEVELRTPSGAVLGEVDFDGLRDGFASGAIFLTGAALADARTDGYELHLCTTAFPTGEMAGFFSFADPVTETRILDAAQLVGTVGASQASATLHLTRYESGRFVLTGHTTGLDLPFTGLELRGPAWFGENGPLVLDLAPYDQSQLASAFFIDVPAGTLTPEQSEDLRDGFQYLLVRTASFPDGALRGQMELEGFMGDTYCRNRPNSVAVIGADISLAGSPRVADRSLVLRGSAFPFQSTVLALAGRGTGHAFMPGDSAGILCLGGASIGRIGITTTQPAGVFGHSFELPIDLATLPVEAGLIVGEHLQFQCWYRDSSSGVATSNFSSAIRFRPR